ncbi:hypothetical protein BVY01_00070, partial [bacterium I07]
KIGLSNQGFSCRDQFGSMLFCHLGQAHSLREICCGLANSIGLTANFSAFLKNLEMGNDFVVHVLPSKEG